jgi:peptide/nickel transport system permease protein
VKTNLTAASPRPQRPSFLSRIWNLYGRGMNSQLSSGLILLAGFVIVGFVLPLFAPVEPGRWNTFPRDLPPQAAHPLGTTSLGQSVFWLLARAIGNSLVIGLAVSVAATVIGVFIGSLAGFVGGFLDRFLSIIIDALIAIPTLPILILFASLFKGAASVTVLIAILVAFNWPWPARQVRAMVLSLRERQFVDVARFSGQSTSRIISREIVPHLIPWSAANLTNTVLVAISIETGLAVIGVSNLNHPTLGTMLYWALQYQALFLGRWWWIVPPAVASILLFISLFLVTTGFSRSRQGAQHA